MTQVTQGLNKHFLESQETLVKDFLSPSQKRFFNPLYKEAVPTAETWVKLIQQDGGKSAGWMSELLGQFDLTSPEGRQLMGLCECLFRIPDRSTRAKKVAETLKQGDWSKIFGENLSTTGKLAQFGLSASKELLKERDGWFSGLWKEVQGVAGSAVAGSVDQVVKQLAGYFVLAESIEDALKESSRSKNDDFMYSFDMLGEGALTTKDAERYAENYALAISAIGKTGPFKSRQQAPGISVKLSALHPRYEVFKKERAVRELVDRLHPLTTLAKANNIGLIIDAEETDRLEMSLEIFEALYTHKTFEGWGGLGLAVQAYQKRAPAVVENLVELAKTHETPITIRLVKGAYWDTEIKHAQERGIEDYPVFTRKSATDVCYLQCAKLMLDAAPLIYPAFGTHNPLTMAMIQHMGQDKIYEFQMLHGMGDQIYRPLVQAKKLGRPCRIYAPVGPYKDLLPYLVRRLLENGANTGFWASLHSETSTENVLRNPLEFLGQTSLEEEVMDSNTLPKLPLPKDLFHPNRKNSQGLNFADAKAQQFVEDAIDAWKPIQTGPLTPGIKKPWPELETHHILSPNDLSLEVGTYGMTSAEVASAAMESAAQGFASWHQRSARSRGLLLRQAADLLEERSPEFMAQIMHEGGRTWQDSLDEVREAVDFLRYYAAQAQEKFEHSQVLPGPTGEQNLLQYEGRGVFVCISPWNFPLAIFLGQVSAALAAGNTVVAKPASQTPLVAYMAIQLLYDAGVPEDAVHFLPGSGKLLGDVLLKHPACAGVAFTGSTETAKNIERTLAAHHQNILPLIAETGGQNCMVVDGSALLEQVVPDVIRSSFQSAGQRCSALRVCYVQKEILDDFYSLLKGAISELTIGHAARSYTDIGPVIDSTARKALQTHCEYLEGKGLLIHKGILSDHETSSYGFAPHVYEIQSISILQGEVFGPILHVIPFEVSDLEKVAQEINSTQYGLTFGIHSRVQSHIDFFTQNVRAGNIYINRNMIGAVVNSQPFGGMGCSGTGFKAGGPNYLLRFAIEKTISRNLSAEGGDIDLLSLDLR